MRKFFDKDKSESGKNGDKNLSDKQKKLIELMMPVVQQYYNKNLTPEEVRAVITDNLKEIQGVMGKILTSEINLENEKILAAMTDADVETELGTASGPEAGSEAGPAVR